MATYTTVDLSLGNFTIPAGVTSGVLYAAGAGVFYIGGRGAYVQGTVAVTAGQVISAVRGRTTTTAAAGSPDGKPGNGNGNGGGGSTTIKVDGVTKLIGPGGGGFGATSTASNYGGDGGYPSGSAGSGGGTPGTGATQSADGTASSASSGGGGGGGGYHKGGSGSNVGGGGGGSGFVDPSLTNVTTGPATQGDGVATFTYRNPVMPTAPIIITPTAGSWVAAGVVPLRFQYPMDDVQSGALIQWRPAGGDSTDIPITDATNVSNVTLPAAGFEWRAQVTSADGLTGPFSQWVPFNTEVMLDLPVMTSPADGSTISDAVFPLDWTAAGQQAWQAQTLDGATAVWDSGQQSEPDTRSVIAGAPVDGRTLTARMRIRGAHVWTPWVSVSVNVAWIGPEAPVVLLRPDPAKGRIGVEWQQPDGDVTPDHYDVQAAEDGQVFPVVSGLPADARHTFFHLPRSDVDTTIRVLAVAASGASTAGEAR